MTVRVWVNGRLLDPDEPALSALDHGVTVGDGVFETAKIVEGKGFALSRHARRLDRSMRGLGLPAADHGRIREGIEAVLGAGEPISFGRLRYIVTASEQARPPESGKVSVVPWTRNDRAATVGLKTTSYAENVIALARAKESGAIEAVFGNNRGELCECTGSNIFVVVDGRILTPPPESGLLEGITRALTIEWCREDGLPVSEETLPLSVLETADEVFITSSTKDVLPIHAVDGRQLPPGPVTAHAAKVFATWAAADFDP